MRKIMFVFLIAVMVLASLAEARSMSLIEKIEADLRKDDAFTPEEREQYLDEFRKQMATYALDVLKGDRKKGADIIMTMVMEGSFDNIPVERIVEVASAAYIAIRRGSDPDVVEGIALYGFRKKIPAESIEAWANGYRDCVKFGVPPYIAEDLVYNAAEHEWDVYTYNKLKWGLVEAAKAGYDMEDFQAYMTGNFLKGGIRAGAMASKAIRYFRQMKTAKKRPELPEYTGSYIPRKESKKRTEERKSAEKVKKDTPKADVKSTKDSTVDQQVDKVVKSAPKEKKGFLSGIFSAIDKMIHAFLGAPYVWGGETPKGTDCSGFVKSVYDEVGVDLPRVSRDQWKEGRTVEYSDLKKGDLVFFRTIGNRISHVGIVSSPGDKKFAHASSSRGVVISDLENRYYKKRYAGAKRVLPETAAAQKDWDRIITAYLTSYHY